jgi:hypothetical protein
VLGSIGVGNLNIIQNRKKLKFHERRKTTMNFQVHRIHTFVHVHESQGGDNP